MRYRHAEPPLQLDRLASARQFFAACFADSPPRRETIWVAHVDAQAHCLHLTRHDGEEIAARFPLKDIIRDAVLHGSAGILLAHNHPSGDATPSDSDFRATRRLVSVADALDCTVIDHLVFGGGQCTSFRSLGLL